MRKRRLGKPPDPIAETYYANEFKKIVDNAQKKMEAFDQLPAVLRQALREEPTGSISVADVYQYLGQIPDETLALAIRENGKMAYSQFMANFERQQDEERIRRNKAFHRDIISKFKERRADDVESPRRKRTPKAKRPREVTGPSRGGTHRERGG